MVDADVTGSIGGECDSYGKTSMYRLGYAHHGGNDYTRCQTKDDVFFFQFELRYKGEDDWKD
jgi:hypothetical protein